MNFKLLFNFLLAFTIIECAVIPEEDDDLDNEIEPYEEDEELEMKYFEQFLNHFDVLDNRTFLQRYIEENSYFHPGGPLLLEIGGEEGISPYSLKNSPSLMLAESLNGKVIMLEHRYYGNSTPFENFTSDELTYLSVEQALEDLAYFVQTMKKTTPGLKNSKVGVFGCSYSASLATWFRYKFPHLVDAAWASSAPLRAAIDFHEYFEVATQVYANVSRKCYNTIREGYSEAQQLLLSPEGKEKVKSMLSNWGCGSLKEMDSSNILTQIRYILADHNISPDHGVESCKMLEPDSDNSTAFENLVKLLVFKSPDVCASEESPEFPNDGMLWSYQTCTEFGFTLTESNKQPFNDSSEEFIKEDLRLCAETFGPEFTEDVMQRGVDRINRVYGSVNLKVTRVLSIHGSQDPWHKLGLNQEVDEEAPVILVEGTSHCADQFLRYQNIPIQLKRAQIRARKIMTKWLR